MASIAVIVPVLNEAAGLAAIMEQARQLTIEGAQLVWVDGGSTDGTAQLLQAGGFQVVASQPGRALQMNTGAAWVTSDRLLFLHADTTLPLSALSEVQRALSGRCVWGRFDVRIQGRSRWLPVVAFMMNVRSRCTGIATGDQALFMTRAAFDAVVQRFAQPSAGYVFTPRPAPDAPRPDADIDAAGLREAWAAMLDTHEFFGLTRRFGVERQQSFRLVEGQFAWRAAPQAITRLLDEAAMDGLPIMVFVSSGGCIQIHTGPVHNIKPLETPSAQWINVLDEGFNLHLRTDMVHSVWVVEKPTADGVVTSVEAFDAAGELIAMFFGARKPGQPELQSWRDLGARLPGVEEVADVAA